MGRVDGKVAIVSSLLRLSWVCLVCLANACAREAQLGHAIEAPPQQLSRVTVTPPELGDPLIVAGITRFARVMNPATFWIHSLLPPQQFTTTSRKPNGEILPVLEISNHRLRVVVGDRSARIAIWIRDTDAVVGVAEVVALTNGRDTTEGPRRLGVWAKPGVPLRVIKSNGVRVQVELEEDFVAVGWISKSVLARAWTVRPTKLSSAGVSQRRSAVRVGAVLRDAPSDDATSFATVRRSTEVRIVGRSGGWYEVERDSVGMYVRGFINSAELVAIAASPESSAQPQPQHATPTQSSAQQDHHYSDVVPAGTCLLAGMTGEILGVTLVEVSDALQAPIRRGWWRLTVLSPWGLIEILAHDQSGGRGEPVWSRCGATS